MRPLGLDPSGNAHHDGSGGHIRDYDSSCADDRIAADCQPGQDHRAGADEGTLADRDTAGEPDPWTDMGAGANPTFVIDRRRGIHDDASLEMSLRTHGCVCQDLTARTEGGVGGDVGGAMDDRQRKQAFIDQPVMKLQTLLPPDRHQEISIISAGP